MKMAKKMLVLAIVATGTLMGSTGTSSALADVGGHLLVQNTGTVNPNGKKGTKKTSASRKRRSVRARNAERRRQRQLKRQRERDLDEFRRVMADIIEDVIAGRTVRGGRAQRQVLLELLDEAIEMGDDEMALRIGDELELCADPDPGPLGTGAVQIDPDSIRRRFPDVNPDDPGIGDEPGTLGEAGVWVMEMFYPGQQPFSQEWYSERATQENQSAWIWYTKKTGNYISFKQWLEMTYGGAAFIVIKDLNDAPN